MRTNRRIHHLSGRVVVCLPAVTHVGVMIMPWDMSLHTIPFPSFWILIFPFISCFPRRPECIGSSTHFVLLGGLHGASCFVWPFPPSDPGVSGVWSLWITPSICLCSQKDRKGTKRIKGNESTDISRRLLLLSKWRMALFVLIHLITPPPHISLFNLPSLHPPHPTQPYFVLACSPCSSYPILIIRNQFASPPSIIEERVKINNSQPMKRELTYIPPDSVSQ